ncbi:hypothetical protein BKH46_08295 [Helicobacter sp. 12S02634-8]|uniref:hypothetical protein n=1 Tax=Helicobacter sp. 12S02634-8 TaxID=1476199 RepID=UPI000BA5A9E1|nr:hypothetical protein [Helicobacter sp. 12S02634-8]PAF46230.1 hypothetical protein BKH46_08295 [Helicobacter sp. 12S02634-8]
MGRYITGDIEHKFWVGIQSSGAATEYGAVAADWTPYVIDKESFDLDYLKEQVEEINRTAQHLEHGLIDINGDPKEMEDRLMDIRETMDGEDWWKIISGEKQWKNVEYANVALGIKLYHALFIEGKDYLEFTAEN